ncbi:NaeI family type II restriction endonuclease [Streptomyces sp. NBC_00347]|uniref:NaeI family type II restriction endonuclease n=1 Tax=Streptomyces sp. NBC_00347 TaxID=2975721 RepID=UPI0022589EFB|nr:NaeI family type II restriction endonuclease [Streptomyces sp. NBC_00347]MCX5125979.1 NaeI family type II restriction endonuclease [Streptomyces sp. NBC_00347]
MLPSDVSAAMIIQGRTALQDDPELGLVYSQLVRLDPDGQRFAMVLRDTIDQLLNGEVTGRYDWKTLFKTEKTHAGTVVEINLQREFAFDDGIEMDYRIAGVDVDCKYSQLFGGWMIPPEAVGHLCLLVWADDYKSQWSAGLLRITPALLNGGSNRDMKLTVKAEHRTKILWLWRDAELPENTLLHMDPADREAVFAQKSGQARLNELFRHAQRRRIGRNVVRTVAQQKDYMKRVRGNGGSRSSLRHEGIIIMGDYRAHQEIARQLALPVPQEGDFVSARVVPSLRGDSRPCAIINGCSWTLAEREDPVTAAPLLPVHTAPAASDV